MITDLCPRDPRPDAASARNSCGRLNPPIARLPTLRNDRRDNPSQSGRREFSMVNTERTS